MSSLNINGKDTPLDVDPNTPILWALRDTLGMTGWHKMFSESRGAWVSASELEIGEVLRGHDGPVVVTQLMRDPAVQRVYNMSVEADHVYYVGAIEALAHNNWCNPMV